MMSNKVTFSLIITLLFLFACGSGVRKQDLGPDAYFEYAKKKFDDGDYVEAITDFTVIVLKFSGNPVVDDAQYYLAESHFKEGEHIIAVAEYNKLLSDYPQSEYRVLAQFKRGMAFYEMSPRPELDQEYTRKAIRSFQEFVEENPGHELTSKAESFIAELRSKLAKKKLTGGDTYRKKGEYEAAIIYYDLVIKEFFDSPPAGDAMYWKGHSLVKLKQYDEAQTTLTLFLEKFPEHKNANKAKELIEESHDNLQKTAKGDS